MDPAQSGDFQQDSPNCFDRIAAPGQQVLSPEALVLIQGVQEGISVGHLGGEQERLCG